MPKRRNVRSADRRQYLAGLLIAGAAIAGLGVEIVYMMTVPA